MQQTRGQELRLLSARVDAGAPAQEGEQPALAPSARPSRPKYYDDRHAASVADVGGILVASGGSSPNVSFKVCTPAKRTSKIIGVVWRALGGRRASA